MANDLQPINAAKRGMTSEGYFRQLSDVISRLPHRDIRAICDVLFAAWEDRRKILVFGNGGSASLASHLACDLGKGTSKPADDRKRVRVVSLVDNIPLMTAWANDTDYSQVFAEQLRNLVDPEDVCFAISGSGNSPNVLNALQVGREAGAITVGISGFAGGRMTHWCDYLAVVPSDNMQIIEDLHLSMAHSIFTVLKSRIEAAEPRALAAGAAD
jgi:D-sedoheptulose 7-phosphate isomerase